MRRVIVAGFILSLVTLVILLFPSQENELQPTSPKSEYEKYALDKIERKQNGAVKADAPEQHALIQRELRTREGMSAPEYGPNQIVEEYQKALQRKAGFRLLADEFNFIERGPGNVAGRTRGLLVDPDDATGQTWYAGSASGGIWKTTNGGGDWAFISEDIPNLGTNTLAMSIANPSVIYAGTGEHFTSDIDGAGIFRSNDKGATWAQVGNPSVYSDMKNVSRMVADPDNEDILIATTRNSVWQAGLEAAIYKTTDGGTNWTQLRSSTTERYDDIVYDPNNFNTLYVAIRGVGVIKSTNGGTSWTDASTGMFPSGRVEIAISPVNSNRLWASVQGGLSGTGSDLYVTSDGGASWNLVVNSDGNNEDFLGGQGWYDNYATAHPFDEDIVYVGGVNNWKFDLAGGSPSSVNALTVTEDGTEAFMDYINFGGGYLRGGLEVNESFPSEDLLSVEIRFGQGTQKAHRFTVGGQGAGVDQTTYTYEDYVDVPFQAWDTDNNVQLMVSFRDQQEDGAWNLIEANTDGASSGHSREYFFVHNIAYDNSNANSSISNNATTEQMYFVWPVLASGAEFNAGSLPNSNLIIDVSSVATLNRITTNVSDAYNQFGGPNSFPQSSRTAGIHPDQHNALITDVNSDNQTFRLFIANDGGVYESISSTNPGPAEDNFNYVSYGYNTTQFYGADKAPGQNRFIGGMQDNGTWYHASGTTGSASADATFGIGGDGFESLWHSTDVNKLIGGSQFNNFARTVDGGSTWLNATNGFDDDGPFITRLNHHKSNPDKIFTVGSQGVWVSEDFGGEWAASTMSSLSLWSFSNSSDVEISYANPDVIWAGSRLSSTGRLYVSTDGGANFSPVENYTAMEMGGVSGIGTHPTDDQIVYSLFSFAGLPKVLKSEDLGQTWEDISGFDGSGDRGFPDVAVNCLFVFPTNTDRIWVGSEIGIIESLDGGASWNLLTSNFPAVNAYDFKLVEDVLVIATYGRGIWSVKLPDFPEFPAVSSLTTSPQGNHEFTFTFAEAFDSTYVYADDSFVLTIYDNAPGQVIEAISNLGLNGVVSVRFEVFNNGNKFSSSPQEIFFLDPLGVANSYGTTFEGAQEEIAGQGFSIRSSSGSFNETALHSLHPYEANGEAFLYVRTPITVASSNAIMTYKDVAIVEPGNDKVIVEGSTDGANWKTLASYDASRHSNWKSAFDSKSNGDPTMYKTQSIDLSDSFSAGDEILVRFRIDANGSVQGYGWVIGDLYIQEERPLSVDNSIDEVSIAPNPVDDFTTIQFTGKVPTSINVLDLNGRLIDELTVPATSNSVVWRPNQLHPGLYIIRYELNGTSQSHKLIVK